MQRGHRLVVLLLSLRVVGYTNAKHYMCVISS